MEEDLKSGPELDALVAEKVMGWVLYGEDGHSKPVHKKSLDRPGETFDDWEYKGPHPRLVSPSGREFFLCQCRYRKGLENLPPYSTDIAAAWEVVEHMTQTTKENWKIEIFSSAFIATFSYESGRDKPWQTGEHEAYGDSIPHAICLAALKAVGEKT